jgi:hypothetical protein
MWVYDQLLQERLAIGIEYGLLDFVFLAASRMKRHSAARSR